MSGVVLSTRSMETLPARAAEAPKLSRAVNLANIVVYNDGVLGKFCKDRREQIYRISERIEETEGSTLCFLPVFISPFSAPRAPFLPLKIYELIMFAVISWMAHTITPQPSSRPELTHTSPIPILSQNYKIHESHTPSGIIATLATLKSHGTVLSGLPHGERL